MAEEPAPPNEPAASIPAPDPAPVPAADASQMSQEALDALLQTAAPAETAVPATEAAAVAATASDVAAVGAPAADPFAAGGALPELDQSAIDELLKQANFEDPSALPPEQHAELPDTSSFELPAFHQAMADAQVSSIDLLRDVELNVKIELGRSRMLVEDVLKLGEGSVVELDKLAGDPVDVFVNDRLVARGEVLVLNDNFCVRVNEIVAGAKDDLP
jgi:flagellar motor switch protein FliN/FliY